MPKSERRGKRDAKSLQRIQRFLDGIRDRAPSPKEVRKILPDLHALAKKIRRLRQMSPNYRSIGISADLLDLLEVAGVSAREVSELRDASAS